MKNGGASGDENTTNPWPRTGRDRATAAVFELALGHGVGEREVARHHGPSHPIYVVVVWKERRGMQSLRGLGPHEEHEGGDLLGEE